MRISDWSSDVCSSDLQDSAEAQTLRLLRQLERKVLWLSSWMIHNANHVRESRDGLKVGGHQASSASLATLMTALYFHVLRPQDRVAVKPHASRSEEHTSELQSLMRISYAVFCLKKKNNKEESKVNKM